MALGYSSIDEAWGMSAEPSRRVRKANKFKKPSPQVQAPAPDVPPEPHMPCHLYEQQAVDDIFSMYQPYSDIMLNEEYEPHPPPADVFPDDTEPTAKSPDATNPSPWLSNKLAEDNASFWEFMAFVFFGILLIVLMENLVQIGMAMRSPF